LNLKDIVHEESIGRLNSENEKRKTRISSQYELRIVREDGEHRDINVSARPLINKDDQYEGTVGLVLDITETKKARLELKKSYETLENTLQSTVLAISKIVESRDPYTSGHQTRTAKLARSIAEEMGFTEDEIKPIYMASVLHDIGKISAPQEILSKPGKLTDLEFEIIKTHPSVGYDILVNIDFPWPISDIVVQHHEKIDGSGYPAGLKNGEILLEARIICVADVVEAMSSHRPYRPALGIDKALEEIREKKGILYDEDVVDACSKIVSHKGFSFE
jgi:putative nucleotidyltransferase with HDIG domain